MEKKTAKKKDRRVEMSVDGLKEDFAWHVRYSLAKTIERATPRDQYTAFANVVRDRIIERWINTQEEYRSQNTKRVYYMSLEFLMGRLLGNNVINLKADQLCREALKEYVIRCTHCVKQKSTAFAVLELTQQFRTLINVTRTIGENHRM